MSVRKPISILSSVSESDQEDNVVKEQIQNVPETPLPTYSEEEIVKLVEYVQKMTILFGLDHRNWTENTVLIIRRWFMEVKELVLTIFYDNNKLISCLGFPAVAVQDLTYFLRKPNEIFELETFHDVIIHGTLLENIDRSFLRTLNLIYAPFFRNYTDWTDNVRFRFYNALDKVLANVTGLHYKMSGCTMLYVPSVKNKLEHEFPAKDREFVKSLESLAVHWGTQIRTCLSDRVLVTPNDLNCPIEYYDFWVYRYEVLQCLKIQLRGEDIQNIVQVLRTAQSVYIQQIEELIAECDNEFNKAKSNVKFLQILVEPSKRIDAAKNPSELPPMLPHFIYLIRFIWLNSEYYNRPDLITGLFRSLSNQIIKFCTHQTNIDKILDGNPRFGIYMCNMSIECCLSYKIIFREILANTWSQDDGIDICGLDEAMIFNHVNAFEERLNDLIDICQSMIVFGRMDETEKIPKALFGGSKGPFFEKKSEDIEMEFLKTLDALKNDSKEMVLDVHRNEWYTEVAKYHKMIRNFEEIVQRLMANAFQTICNVEEGLEVLITLHCFSFRDSLRETYLKQVSQIWSMFITDLSNASEKLKDQASYCESWIPKFSSKALIYKINTERLTCIKERLEMSEWLPEVPLSKVAFEKFDIYIEEFRTEMQKSFKSWIKTVDSDVLPKLNRTLLIRSKIRKGLLECNIERTLLHFCDEARIFTQLGFHIPSNINKQISKCLGLKYVSNSVITVCLNYNRILAVLSSGERKLFTALIEMCDNKISQGISKLCWDGEFSNVYIMDCAEHTLNLQHSVDTYKRANLSICRACEIICNFTFFEISSTCQTLESFEKNIENQCKAAKKILSKQISVILDLILAVKREFESVYSNMISQWTFYIQRLDDMLEAALLSCVRNSLFYVYNLLRGNGSAGPAQILLVHVDIEEQKIIFSPNPKEIIAVFQNILPRVTRVLKDFHRLCQKFKLSSFSGAFSDLVGSHPDCVAVNEKVMQEVKYNIIELEAFLINWTKFQPIWEMQEYTFLKKWEESEQTAEEFADSIEDYYGLANEVAIRETISSIHFIRLDSSKLKNSILDFIDKWQGLNFKLLKKKLSERIKGIYKYMSINIERLSIIPRTLIQIKEANKLYEKLVGEISEKANEFPAIFALFKVLDEYQIEFPPTTLELLIKLDSEWQNYLKILLESDEILGNGKEELKDEISIQANYFKVTIKGLMEDFLLKAPSSSDMFSNLI